MSNDIKMSFRDKKEAKRLFQELLLYNVLIEKACIKHPKNIDLLHKIPFYNEVSVKQASNAFKR